MEKHTYHKEQQKGGHTEASAGLAHGDADNQPPIWADYKNIVKNNEGDKSFELGVNLTIALDAVAVFSQKVGLITVA